MVAAYDAGIAYQDAGLRELVVRLKAQDLYDRSLIVVTADHGEAFGEHGLFAHGNGVYRVETHVPLVIKFPNQRSGAVVDGSVSGVYLMPTILEAAGGAIPALSQGMSLAHPVPADREVFSESFPSPGMNAFLDRVERSIQSAQTKLIVSNRGKREYYDVARDPQELTPRLPDGTLNERLRQWTLGMPSAVRKPSRQDTRAIQQLKSLGYVQ